MTHASPHLPLLLGLVYVPGASPPCVPWVLFIMNDASLYWTLLVGLYLVWLILTDVFPPCTIQFFFVTDAFPHWNLLGLVYHGRCLSSLDFARFG